MVLVLVLVRQGNGERARFRPNEREAVAIFRLGVSVNL